MSLFGATVDVWAPTAGFSLVGLIFVFTWRLIKQYQASIAAFVTPANETIKRLEEEVARLRSSNLRMERRISLLIRSMQEAKVEIPQEVWTQ